MDDVRRRKTRDFVVALAVAEASAALATPQRLRRHRYGHRGDHRRQLDRLDLPWVVRNPLRLPAPPRAWHVGHAWRPSQPAGHTWRRTH